MTENNQSKDVLNYKGSNFLKQRLILAVLSGKSINITNIRSSIDETNPGIKEFEVGLIRLIDKITNGTEIKLNKSGTSLLFKPGLLYGGTITHDCCLQRGIGYYLDALIALGPFCKNPLNVKLFGVTNTPDSPSVDEIKSSALIVLKKFIVVDDGLELKLVKRGLLPDGGGEVIFKCPVRKNIKAVQFLEQGMIKRIRGTAFACKVSPAMANRTIESAKGVMLNFLPDVYIQCDQNKGKSCGNSPGYGISLVAESTEGVNYVVEIQANRTSDETDPIVPEELGKQVALKLLDEIYRGGCVQSTFQWLVVLYMALAENTSKYLTGPLSQYTISFLQHLRDFFAKTFVIQNPEVDDDENDNYDGSQKVLLTCKGIAYTNISKRII